MQHARPEPTRFCSRVHAPQDEAPAQQAATAHNRTHFLLPRSGPICRHLVKLHAVHFFFFFPLFSSSEVGGRAEPWLQAVYTRALVAAQDGVCSREHAAPRGRVYLPCPAPTVVFRVSLFTLVLRWQQLRALVSETAV